MRTLSEAAGEHVPPQGVRSNAKRGLEMVKNGEAGDGLESATIARARKIAAGQALTDAHVKRMHSFFERHDKTRPDDGGRGESPWRTAWMLWGGDAGRRWARSVAGQLDESALSLNIGSLLVVADADENETLLTEPIDDSGRKPDLQEASIPVEKIKSLIKPNFNPDQPRWPKDSPQSKGGQFMQVGQRFVFKNKTYEISAIHGSQITAQLATGGNKPDEISLKAEPKDGEEGNVIDVVPAKPKKIDGQSGYEKKAPGQVVISPYVDSSTHDPSIEKPDIGITDEEWERFGVEDQKQLLHLIDRFGDWSPEKSAQIINKIKGDYSDKARQAVYDALDEQYKDGANDNSGQTLSLAQVFDNASSVVKGTKEYEEAKLLLRDAAEAIQWDVYHRVKAPDVALSHWGHTSPTDNRNKWFDQEIPLIGAWAMSMGFDTNDSFGPYITAIPFAVRHLEMNTKSGGVYTNFSSEEEATTGARSRLEQDKTFMSSGSGIPSAVRQFLAAHMVNSANPASGKVVYDAINALSDPDYELELPPQPANLKHKNNASNEPTYKELPPAVGEEAVKVGMAAEYSGGSQEEAKKTLSAHVEDGLKAGDFIEGMAGTRYVVIDDPSDSSASLRYVKIGKSGDALPAPDYDKSFRFSDSYGNEFYRLDAKIDIPEPKVEDEKAFKGLTQAEQDALTPSGDAMLVEKMEPETLIKVDGTVFKIQSVGPSSTTLISMKSGEEWSINSAYKTEPLGVLGNPIDLQANWGDHIIVEQDGVEKVAYFIAKEKNPDTEEFTGNIHVSVFDENGEQTSVTIPGATARRIPETHYGPQDVEVGDQFSKDGKKWTVTSMLKDGTVRAKPTGGKVEKFPSPYEDIKDDTHLRPDDWSIGEKTKAKELAVGDLVSGSAVKFRPYRVMEVSADKKKVIFRNLETGEFTTSTGNKSWPVLLTKNTPESSGPAAMPDASEPMVPEPDSNNTIRVPKDITVAQANKLMDDAPEGSKMIVEQVIGGKVTTFTKKINDDGSYDFVGASGGKVKQASSNKTHGQLLVGSLQGTDVADPNVNWVKIEYPAPLHPAKDKPFLATVNIMDSFPVGAKIEKLDGYSDGTYWVKTGDGWVINTPGESLTDQTLIPATGFAVVSDDEGIQYVYRGQVDDPNNSYLTQPYSNANDFNDLPIGSTLKINNPTTLKEEYNGGGVMVKTGPDLWSAKGMPEGAGLGNQGMENQTFKYGIEWQLVDGDEAPVPAPPQINAGTDYTFPANSTQAEVKSALSSAPVGTIVKGISSSGYTVQYYMAASDEWKSLTTESDMVKDTNEISKLVANTTGIDSASVQLVTPKSLPNLALYEFPGAKTIEKADFLDALSQDTRILYKGKVMFVKNDGNWVSDDGVVTDVSGSAVTKILQLGGWDSPDWSIMLPPEYKSKSATDLENLPSESRLTFFHDGKVATITKLGDTWSANDKASDAYMFYVDSSLDGPVYTNLEVSKLLAEQPKMALELPSGPAIAGLELPATASTVEALEDLPLNTVIRDNDGDLWKRYEGGWVLKPKGSALYDESEVYTSATLLDYFPEFVVQPDLAKEGLGPFNPGDKFYATEENIADAPIGTVMHSPITGASMKFTKIGADKWEWQGDIKDNDWLVDDGTGDPDFHYVIDSWGDGGTPKMGAAINADTKNIEAAPIGTKLDSSASVWEKISADTWENDYGQTADTAEMADGTEHTVVYWPGSVPQVGDEMFVTEDIAIAAPIGAKLQVTGGGSTWVKQGDNVWVVDGGVTTLSNNGMGDGDSHTVVEWPGSIPPANAGVQLTAGQEVTTPEQVANAAPGSTMEFGDNKLWIKNFDQSWNIIKKSEVDTVEASKLNTDTAKPNDWFSDLLPITAAEPVTFQTEVVSYPPALGSQWKATEAFIEAAPVGAVLSDPSGDVWKKEATGQWLSLTQLAAGDDPEPIAGSFMADGDKHKIIAWPLGGDSAPEYAVGSEVSLDVNLANAAPVGTTMKDQLSGKDWQKVGIDVWEDLSGDESNITSEIMADGGTHEVVTWGWKSSPFVSSSGLSVGDTVPAEEQAFASLPIGATITDKDGDPWTKKQEGWKFKGSVTWSDDETMIAQDSSFGPFTVSSLPGAVEQTFGPASLSKGSIFVTPGLSYYEVVTLPEGDQVGVKKVIKDSKHQPGQFLPFTASELAGAEAAEAPAVTGKQLSAADLPPASKKGLQGFKYAKYKDTVNVPVSSLPPGSVFMDKSKTKWMLKAKGESGKKAIITDGNANYWVKEDTLVRSLNDTVTVSGGSTTGSEKVGELGELADAPVGTKVMFDSIFAADKSIWKKIEQGDHSGEFEYDTENDIWEMEEGPEGIDTTLNTEELSSGIGSLKFMPGKAPFVDNSPSLFQKPDAVVLSGLGDVMQPFKYSKWGETTFDEVGTLQPGSEFEDKTKTKFRVVGHVPIDWTIYEDVLTGKQYRASAKNRVRVVKAALPPESMKDDTQKLSEAPVMVAANG